MRTPAERSKARSAELLCGLNSLIIVLTSERLTGECRSWQPNAKLFLKKKKNGTEEVLPEHSGSGKLASLLEVGVPRRLGPETRQRPTHLPILS